MQARARLLGHPIHQMLIPIPLGLLVTGVILDVVARFVRVEALTVVSFWNLAIAIGGGVLAAIFGLVDWLEIPKGTRARRVGALHGIGNVVMLFLVASAVALRAGERFFRVPDVALGLEVGALALAVATGWLGGELVDRLGIGVEPDAHPNAPSSLRSRRDRGAHLEAPPRRKARTTLPYGPPKHA
jgi:uncharacterized membrane protein